MKNVPNLRFKEFSEELEYKKLGEIVDYKKGYAFKSNNYCDSGTRIIKISDTSSNSIKDDDITCISDEKAVDYKEWQLQEDDIVVSTVGSRPPLYSSMVGKIILVPKRYQDSLLNQNLVRLRTNELSTQRYLYCCLNRKRYIKHIEGICRGNANQVSITLEDLFDYQLRLPSLVEQEKIASFLSLIDKKIELQTEKVEELKNYKKGIMQKIFSQELRFKDENGNEYPERKIGRLGEYLSNKGGTALEKYVEDEGTHNFISIGNYSIDGNYIDTGQRINLNDKTQEKLLNKNDLVMVLNDKTASGDLIGSTILIDEDNKYIYNQRSERLICNSAISPDFCWVLLNSKMFRKKVFSIAQGGTQIYVNFSSVKNLEIEFPHLKEQEKIAHFIFNLNTKLNKEQEKLDMLLTYKKGLLQQMFI